MRSLERHRPRARHDLRRLRQPHHLRGITLIEMAMALVILALLTALGMSAFQEVLRRQRLLACVADFRSAIRLARAEALRRGRPVALLPADGRNWSTGWRVEAIPLVDSETGLDRVIARQPAVSGGIAIAQFFTDANRHLTYNGSGRSSDLDGDGQRFGRLRFTAGTMQRDIVINAMGRERTCQPAEGPAASPASSAATASC